MKTAINPRPEGAYHHGDLRKALIQAGWDLIEEAGIKALTLRAVASRLNVTQTASAYHFGDKEGLEAAIATECFRRLTSMLTRLRAKSTEPKSCLAGMLRGYLEFSQSFPAGFALMFSARLARNSRHAELLAASRICYDLLEDAVLRVLANDGDDDECVRNATVAAWSLIHGLAGIQSGFGLPSKVRAAATFEQMRDRVIAGFVRSLPLY